MSWLLPMMVLMSFGPGLWAQAPGEDDYVSPEQLREYEAKFSGPKRSKELRPKIRNRSRRTYSNPFYRPSAAGPVTSKHVYKELPRASWEPDDLVEQQFCLKMDALERNARRWDERQKALGDTHGDFEGSGGAALSGNPYRKKLNDPQYRAKVKASIRAHLKRTSPELLRSAKSAKSKASKPTRRESSIAKEYRSGPVYGPKEKKATKESKAASKTPCEKGQCPLKKYLKVSELKHVNVKECKNGQCPLKKQLLEKKYDELLKQATAFLGIMLKGLMASRSRPSNWFPEFDVNGCFKAQNFFDSLYSKRQEYVSDLPEPSLECRVFGEVKYLGENAIVTDLGIHDAPPFTYSKMRLGIQKDEGADNFKMAGEEGVIKTEKGEIKFNLLVEGTVDRPQKNGVRPEGGWVQFISVYGDELKFTMALP